MIDDAFARAVAALSERGPGRMVPDLSRITELATLLGDPQRAYPSVHVTGTNGKGSVVRMVAALCSAAGLTAGTYTSPHLQTVRERLGIAGRAISPPRFAEVLDEVLPLVELLDARAAERDGPGADRVTYFELLTAMAYWWFADAPVDVGVFEVGMGGRWDATNLVRGDVAVLNAVDVDHPQLGGTPAEVAREKVGIIKPGAQVVVAEQPPEVQAVVDRAIADAGATAWRVGHELEVVDDVVAIGGRLVALRVGERVVDDVLLPLHGTHQTRNALLALGALAALTGVAFDAMDDEVVRQGLGAVEVPGRLEIVQRDPTIVLDGAHNPHGAAAAAHALATSFDFRELVLVAACLDDKDVVGILRPFRDLAARVVVTELDDERAAPLAAMTAAAAEVWRGTTVPVAQAPDVAAALALAREGVGDGDGIAVVGSLRTVGSVRDLLLPVDDDESDEPILEPEDLDDPGPPRLGDGLDDLDG